MININRRLMLAITCSKSTLTKIKLMLFVFHTLAERTYLFKKNTNWRIFICDWFDKFTRYRGMKCLRIKYFYKEWVDLRYSHMRLNKEYIIMHWVSKNIYYYYFKFLKNLI